jgi:two-component system chemotaxis response regulator CheB
MTENNDFMIVIGASAGGITAVCEVLSRLDPGIDASIGIVIHLSPQSTTDWLLLRMRECTRLDCMIATDRMPLRKGCVYIAPANYHMIVEEKMILLGQGPMEGRWRPSINVTFRSAAVARNSHCIGIILSGLLDDGVSGMNAIRNCGGYCIVQDPGQAQYPDMPLSVLGNMEVDQTLCLEDIPSNLEDRIKEDPGPAPVPEVIRREAALSQQAATDIDSLKEIGKDTVYSCPDCGGGLWEIKNGGLGHYRCHIGHSYTEKELSQGQAKAIENTLWIALRMMEERRYLLASLSEKESERGQKHLSEAHHERAEEMRMHIGRLKELLFSHADKNPD